MSRWMLLAALLCAAPALAGEPELRPGPGRDLVEANCAACHTLNYIRMNSPFLDEKGWTAEVNKMVNTFGAPVDRADVPKIIAYLTEQYGPAR
ncbi:MAG: cytochrome c [Acetobacteraceae bacterium]|nr:cytochrome c [Acetobacteraceae bacterium]MDI3305793.1 cytochrome c [Acetobacteraceae bacterium]